jgi:hypothetical protein
MLPGPDRLRSSYGNPPEALAKAEDPAYLSVASSSLSFASNLA